MQPRVTSLAEAALCAQRAARAAWRRRHTPLPSPTAFVIAHWAYGGGLTLDLERRAAFIGGGPTREQTVTTHGW